MKYQDWNGYITKLCAEANDFSHLDEPLFPYDVCADPVHQFYNDLEFPEWVKSENRRETMLDKFRYGSLKEIQRYFEIVPIVRKKEDKITVDDYPFKYTIEPERRFIYSEVISKDTNSIEYPSYRFMFFVNFELLGIRHYQVRQRIFDIISKNIIWPFNVTTNLQDDHYEYYHFKARIFKYRYQKIPVIRKLTGIQKPENNIIGLEMIYKMHLYHSDGNKNSLFMCR